MAAERLDLTSTSGNIPERNAFWIKSVIEMKCRSEREWIKSVRAAKGKPNYGMGQMDSVHEEVCHNKLELSGPLIDAYLEELGKSLRQKLVRANATGLLNSTVLFTPRSVFKHIVTLCKGYGADISTNPKTKSKTKAFTITINKRSTAAKKTYLKRRHFKKTNSVSSILQILWFIISC